MARAKKTNTLETKVIPANDDAEVKVALDKALDSFEALKDETENLQDTNITTLAVGIIAEPEAKEQPYQKLNTQRIEEAHYQMSKELKVPVHIAKDIWEKHKAFILKEFYGQR